MVPDGARQQPQTTWRIKCRKRMLRQDRDGLINIRSIIISTLYEESERALNNANDQLKETLGQNDIGLKSATYVQELAYNSNKPIMDNQRNGILLINAH